MVAGRVHTVEVEKNRPTWVHTSDGWHPAEPGTDGPPFDVRAGDTVWVRAADHDDLLAAARELGLPADVVATAGTHGPSGRRGRPHVEHLTGGVFLATPTVAFSEEGADVLSGEVTCLALDGVVLTVETGPAEVLDEVAERLAAAPPTGDALTSGLLATLLAALVSGAAEVEAALGDAVEALDAEVFSASRTSPVEPIYALKREVAEARRALAPLTVELPELVPADDEAGEVWQRRLTVAVDRLDHRLEAHDRLLADMLAAHLSLVSVRQNDDVRRISAWAAIAAAPTLIASVYGMNFHDMPELGWPWGYPAALAFMALVSVGLHRLFTRSGWL